MRLILAALALMLSAAAALAEAPVCQSQGFVCSNTPVTNGICGTVNGKKLPTPPLTDHCAAGRAANGADGATAWTWQCVGANGGTTATCASIKVAAPTSKLTPTRTPTPTPSPTPGPSGQAFSEDFKTAESMGRFDKGFAGEWNAGALAGGALNDWHGDHDHSCANPNTTGRTITLTSQQQANEAVFYRCEPESNIDKAHMMTTANTVGWVIVWFSPKPVFNNVAKVCWDQNITDMGGGKWVLVNFLTPTEYAGKTNLGYSHPGVDGVPGIAGAAKNGVKFFRHDVSTYTNNVFRQNVIMDKSTVTDKAARFKHCIADNENGTLTISYVEPSGGMVKKIVPGAIPDGDVRVQFADESYNPDKHFDAVGVPHNSSKLYTWHWDNIEVFARP